MRSKTRKRTGLLLLLLPLLVAAAMLLYYAGCFDSLLYGADSAKAVIAPFAREHRISMDAYPESIIALLDRNPETKEFVLNYPLRAELAADVDLTSYHTDDGVPLFLQWDMQWGYIPYGSDVAGITGCGPVCLSMAAYYLTGDDAYSPDRMIDFAFNNGYYSPGNGSSWTLISEGAVKLGFDVTEIPLDEDRIIRNLQVNNPIICVMGPGDFTTTGHYIVMTGYQDGMIKVNDPNSIENSGKLWQYDAIKDQIRNLWVIRN